MGKMSRRDFIFGVQAVLIGGCGLDPSSLDTYLDTYAEDTGLPPLGDDPHAQELYLEDELENSLNNPRKLLFRGDFDHAEFRCSRNEPVDIVVGFGREFSRITIGFYCDRRLNVEGYAVSRLGLAGLGDTRRFVRNLSRGEEGYADARPLDNFGFGGEIQIDTGPGSERQLRVRMWPDSGEVKVGIDYLKAGV